MDQAHQIDLMTGAAEDYQNGLLSLGNLINIIQALLGILEDQDLREQLWESRCTLEEIHGVVETTDFDFEKYGRSAVEQAVADIVTRTRAASALILSKSPPE